jgi:hypothetical protein
MKAVLLAGLLAAASLQGANIVEFPNAGALASALRELSHSLESGKPPKIPDVWRVQTADGVFSISTAAAKHPAGAQTWLDHLARQLEQYDSHSSRADVRSVLKRILARPEFAGNGPPSAWERFRQRVFAWIGRWLARFFTAMGGHATGAWLVFWLVLIGAAGLLAFWVIQRARNTAGLQLSGAPQDVPVRTWDEWIAAAQGAARAGDLRSAVQCSYWAGVTRLQAKGALPPDRTRTPREYLRALAASESAGPFRALAQSLERCWYAYVPATPEDFSRCLQSLEALGCKVN